MRRIAVLFSVMTIGLSLAACSSNASSTNSGTSAVSTSGTKIKIMALGDLASPALAFPQLATGAQAAVDKVNAAGGVSGHQVELLTCNSQDNPNVAAACAREAVSDKVAAVVGMLSLQSESVEPILAAAHIPSIGTVDINPLDHTSPVSFPIQSAPFQILAEAVTMPGWRSCKHPAMLEDNTLPTAVQGTKFISNLYASLSPPVRLKVVTATSTVVNLQPDVAELMSGGTDCVYDATTSTPALTMVQEIHAMGVKVKISISSSTTDPAQLTALGAAGQGVYSSSNYQLPGTSPAGSAFSTAMRAVNPKALQDATAENAYASVLIFAAVAKGLSDFSGPSILRALNSAKNIDVSVIPTIASFPLNSGIPDFPRVTQTRFYAYVEKGSNFSLLSPAPINVLTYAKM